MPMDEVDRKILGMLRGNARMPASEIAREVGLSGASVARRIERLEANGTIRGYVTVIDDATAGELDAFTEIRLRSGVEAREFEEIAKEVSEIQQYYTIAGDPDGLVRFRARNVDHLQQVVNSIRKTPIVAGTKTLIVMSVWDRNVLDSLS
ncbi:Lrp/AsnC family transcriptional regulator [Leucobacter denitrificans]|uniref:Lrp/AsnC family transcriptional regulator n=2 Tax=Leucobacter denitrificans TaxID=683042 RepID=A0A7G9S7G6_9MICO|nr:Lrp/AsnC family transcriptional regulator [Leucobacter denitrificans]